MQKVIITLTVIALIVLFFWAIGTGLDRQAKADCETWRNQANEFEGFYLTQWQKDQCDAVGVEVNAPVK